MAAPPIGSQVPASVDTTWLLAYAGLDDRDEVELDTLLHDHGRSVEEVCVVKRADEWTSKVHVADQRLLEREYRFYTELAAIKAQAEKEASIRQAQAEEEEEAQEPSSPSSPSSPKRPATPSNFVLTCLSKSKAIHPDVRPGVVPSLGNIRDTGIEGMYQVLRPRVSVHCSPNTKASLLGVLHHHTLVRGLAFAAADGEPWLYLHEDTMEDMKLRQQSAFVPLAAKRLGCGDLLKRVPGHPGPSRNGWRPSIVTKAETREPVEFERWKRFVHGLLDKALRLPRCLAASFKGASAPETFLLVLERLELPEWTGGDPAIGCSIDQAAGAVEALAGFHNSFQDNRKLAGLDWLPTMPLQENTGHAESIYRHDFNEHREFLQHCMSDRAFAVLEKFCECYNPLAKQLMQPPLTLLHGNFHPGCLKFSASSPDTPTVAAYDWQFVCRGRGAYDFAMFLGLFASIEVRQECEMELMMRYLMGRGLSGRQAREDFKVDVRAGLLVAFAFFFMNVAPQLKADPTARAMLAIKTSIARFAGAIDEWDCSESVGGVAIEKVKKKRPYMRKSKRKQPPTKSNSPESPRPAKEKPQKAGKATLASQKLCSTGEAASRKARSKSPGKHKPAKTKA